MAAHDVVIRRGLPRTPGGPPWPPAAPSSTGSSGAATAAPAAPRADLSDTAIVRRGLPRLSGGEPWPPAAPALTDPTPAMPAPDAPTSAGQSAESTAAQTTSADSLAPVTAAAPAHPLAGDAAQTAGGGHAPPSPGQATSVRRGLPRTAGGAPWPPAGTVPSAASQPPPSTADARSAAEPVPSPSATPARSAPRRSYDLTVPLTVPRTVWAGAAASRPTASRPAAARAQAASPARPTWTQALAGLLALGAMLLLAAMLVLGVRWLVSLDVLRDFLTAYPGEYPLPASTEPGFPAWAQWQHFLNVFFIVLIIRTGLRVRTEKRPTAFWSPRGSQKKISLTLWLHQGLDVLWLVNGVLFVVLLFASGHWARIVPTSWEVFPNALSAVLQYVSLDWPTENGWVNYNSLQQLAYFTTVFIAAPLATITGVRMSGIWPAKATTLNRLYPVEWARAIHFPVMLYFIAFIVVHVALVLATGALRNLNHMYGGQDAVNWVGFWIFAASIVVIIAGWVAARPLVVAPIARLFGTTTGR